MINTTHTYIEKKQNNFEVYVKLNKGNNLEFNSKNINFDNIENIFGDSIKTNYDYKIIVDKVDNGLQVDTKNIIQKI